MHFKVRNNLSIKFFILNVLTVSVILNTMACRHDKGRNFYIDSSAGNDQNDGLSQSSPWKNLEKVNETVFRPGDKILFKAGTRYQGQLRPQGSGSVEHPIIIDRYGDGDRPLIASEGKFSEALLIKNQEYWEVNNLELTNTGETREEFRYGVRLLAWDYGTVHHIQLKNIFVHNINGSLVKNRGEGQGIVWENGGKNIRSRFKDLLIENCHLLRTDRNGICGYSEHSDRTEWFPSTNVVIRNNLLEDIGGDCIKPWGSDSVLIERNVVRGGRQRCDDYAAGIWPWSCDNVVIQYNEVSGIKGKKDGQSFDSDGNCQNIIFQYNYTHDNEGGFMLMCNDGAWKMPNSVGNTGTIIRYNISQNDHTRLFHFAGPCKNTKIYNNVFYVGKEIDLHLFLWTDYNGWSDETYIYNNIFYVEGIGRNSWAVQRNNMRDGTFLSFPGFGQSTNYNFKNNIFYGNFEDIPEDWKSGYINPMLIDPGSGKEGFDSLVCYNLKDGSPCIGAGLPILNNGGRDFWGNSVSEHDPPAIGIHEKQ